MKNIMVHFKDGNSVEFKCETITIRDSELVGEFTFYDEEGESNEVKVHVNPKDVKSVLVEDLDNVSFPLPHARRRRRGDLH